eukprot:TRINITY_DN18939_c0_g1::TRINITY_DN18939_c0_g1_i2::g.21707::m.21707 TRINITY_DN18939_c0_g1::TRINITY_DN18939_c0_g1_i2::g.21707  ORF type:complete len:325 (-),score=24.39,sp/Q4QQR9/MEMO1_RAT/48.61/4e-92,Memo/PF01875.12/2.7e-82,LigB/PF02900.13/2.2e+03,LigB/PF02900.13/0.0023 TRINITY_DN18939_c0_g1_i2:641-1555(-)
MPSIRAASHAGSWYTDNPSKLQDAFKSWLDAVPREDYGKVRAIIGPHAGYSYSGPVSAWAYANLQVADVKRVFLLGPSHHYYLSACALSQYKAYQTPIGDIPLDSQVIAELQATNLFENIDASDDEAEHSLEMHVPYIRYIYRNQKITLVPILVGSIDERAEAKYGALLAKYFENPENVFVISSDFCHWGKRFQYSPYDRSVGEIHQFIEQLDHEGMSAIESGNPTEFTTYLKKTKNTICGRHPITVLMQILQRVDQEYRIQFVRYAQSSPCKSMSDSSVSYAAAVVCPVAHHGSTTPENTGQN